GLNQPVLAITHQSLSILQVMGLILRRLYMALALTLIAMGSRSSYRGQHPAQTTPFSCLIAIAMALSTMGVSCLATSPHSHLHLPESHETGLTRSLSTTSLRT